MNYRKRDIETQFYQKIKIKSLAAWSTSERRLDQKQIFNFVQPNGNCLMLDF